MMKIKYLYLLSLPDWKCIPLILMAKIMTLLQVTSLGSIVGPKGVTIKLLTSTASPEVLLTTTTQEGGGFILTPVKPGQYVIEASHNK